MRHRFDSVEGRLEEIPLSLRRKFEGEDIEQDVAFFTLFIEMEGKPGIEQLRGHVGWSRERLYAFYEDSSGEGIFIPAAEAPSVAFTAILQYLGARPAAEGKGRGL